MVAMARKQLARMPLILWLYSQLTWRRMGCFFIPASSSRKNIETGHLSHSMVHGIELLNPRKGFMWLLYLSAMANHLGNGRYLRMDFPEVLKILLPEVHYTGPAAWHRDPMVLFTLQMT